MWLTILLKYKKEMAIGLAVVVFAIILYYSLKPKAHSVELPNDQVDQEPNSGEILFAENLAANLKAEMYTGNMFTNAEPFEQLAQMSDRMLVLVYNSYLSLYDESLREKIDNGYFVTWGSLTDLIFEVILPRMDKLKLV